MLVIKVLSALCKIFERISVACICSKYQKLFPHLEKVCIVIVIVLCYILTYSYTCIRDDIECTQVWV